VSIVLLALVILLLSLAGGLAPKYLHRRLSSDRLADITGVSSGLLLASALLVVVPEGFHVASESGDEISPVLLGLAVLAGFILMIVLEGLGIGHDVHEEHHEHVEGHGHGHVHHPTSVPVLALGLSVHAAADGLAIGAAALAGDTAFSVLVALAVLIHRVPAAFSLGVFVHHETTDSARATLAIAAFSLATPLTMLLTYTLLDSASDRLIALALLFSAGTFVYVATVDTLPSMHNPETGRRSLRNVLLGIAIFGALVIVASAGDFLEHSH